MNGDPGRGAPFHIYPVRYTRTSANTIREYHTTIEPSTPHPHARTVPYFPALGPICCLVHRYSHHTRTPTVLYPTHIVLTLVTSTIQLNSYPYRHILIILHHFPYTLSAHPYCSPFTVAHRHTNRVRIRGLTPYSSLWYSHTMK